MTPEQKAFNEKLKDSLEGLTNSSPYLNDMDIDKLRVILEAAQKLHDLWPTLCELDEGISNIPENIEYLATHDCFCRSASHTRPERLKSLGLLRDMRNSAHETISKAISGGGDA